MALQAVKPWMSDEDIRVGTVWDAKLTEELAESSVGIICLTPENGSAREFDGTPNWRGFQDLGLLVEVGGGGGCGLVVSSWAAGCPSWSLVGEGAAFGATVSGRNCFIL